MKNYLPIGLGLAAAALFTFHQTWPALAQGNDPQVRGCALSVQPETGTLLGMSARDAYGGSLVTWTPPYAMPLPQGHMIVTAVYGAGATGSVEVVFTCSNKTVFAFVPFGCGTLETNSDGTVSMDFATDADCGPCTLSVSASPCIIPLVNTNFTGTTNLPLQ